MVEGGGDEAGEQGMRAVRLGLELGVELCADMEWMIRELDDLHQAFLGRDRRDHQPRFLQLLLIVGVEFIAVAVALVDAVLIAIEVCGLGAGEEDRLA